MSTVAESRSHHVPHEPGSNGPDDPGAAHLRRGTRRSAALRPALALGLALAMASPCAWSLGKRPPPPGGPVTAGLDKALIGAGHCQALRDCFELLPFAAEHGEPVRVRFFRVSDRNVAALVTAIGFVVRQAYRQADAVPTELEAFRESEEDYQESGLIFGRLRPVLTLTVSP